MSKDRLFLAARICEELLDRPTHEHDRALAEACAGDGALETLVRELLANQRTQLEGFLEPVGDTELGCELGVFGGARPPVEFEDDGDDTGKVTWVGNYRVLEELGAGGQGRVYLAEDRHLKRRVALKLLTSAFRLSSHARARFHREAALASRLHHPGICTVYEIGEHQGMPFMAMRLVEGISLDRYLRARAGQEAAMESNPECDPGNMPSELLDLIQSIAFFEGVARTLHAAHEVGLVHRDIKPGNIMVDGDGRGVVLDFGLARDEESEDGTLTETGDLMGTPAYMSPEQLDGGKRLDRRTDVWSFGVTMYECLALAHPFPATTREDLFQKIRLANPLRLPVRRGGVLRDLQVVLDTALEKHPDQRYQTFLQLAEDLAATRERRPIQARPASRFARAVRWIQRRPVVTTVATLLVVATLTIAMLAGYLFANLDDIRSSERQRLAERVEALLDEGYFALMETGASEALGLFRDALELDAESPEAMAGEIRALVELREGAAARAALARAREVISDAAALSALERSVKKLEGKQPAPSLHVDVADSPTTPFGCFVIATEELLAADRALDLVLAQGHAKNASELLERAVLSTSPARRVYHLRLAQALGAQKAPPVRSARSLALAEALVGLWPSSPLASLHAGLVCSQNLPERAEQEFLRALALTPPGNKLRGAIWSNIGVLRAQHGLPGVEEAFRESVAANRNLSVSWYNLANVRQRQGRPEEALEALREAVRINPRHGPSWSNIASILSEQGQQDEAESAFRRAIDVAPWLPEARNGLAGILSATGRSDEAEKMYRDIVASHPQFPYAHYNLGNIHRSRLEMDEAEACYREATELKTDYPEAWCNLGVVLRLFGRVEESLACYRKGHALGTARGKLWRYDSAQWVAEAEARAKALIQARVSLDSIVAGDRPDRETLIQHNERLLAINALVDLVKFWDRLMTKFPSLPREAGDLAGLVVLVGAQHSGVAEVLGGKEACRAKGLTWVRAFVAEIERTESVRQHRRSLLRLIRAQELDALRDPQRLAKLPESERTAWTDLWERLRDLLGE